MSNDKKSKFPQITQLTEEQRANLAVYHEKWVALALSTGRMTEEERHRVPVHVHGLYAAAKLDLPKAVVVVPGPLCMALAGGAAAWWWHQRKEGREPPASGPFAEAVAADSMRYAKAGIAPTAVRDAVFAATYPGEANGKFSKLDPAVAECQRMWYLPTQGGNLWAGWACFLDYWDHILGQREDCAEAFQRARHWIELAKISGYRWMAPDFCMVSEKPTVFRTEMMGQTYRPHCEDGPTHSWADGFRIWHWHGVRVQRAVVEQPESITIDQIKTESNAEVRRVLRERFGEGRYLMETGAKLLDSDFGPGGGAPRALIQDNEDQRYLVGSDGSTTRTYYMRVGQTVKTCKEAHESLCGFSEQLIPLES